MENPTLYRKRIIPEECICLKDDVILSINQDIIVTKWQALKPKKDLHHGFSCYFLKSGYKVSKFMRSDGSLLYWYCDIISYEHFPADHRIVVTDLLADVIITPENKVRILDLDELTLAHREEKISNEQLLYALSSLDTLLRLIFSGNFSTLTAFISNYESSTI